MGKRRRRKKEWKKTRRKKKRKDRTKKTGYKKGFRKKKDIQLTSNKTKFMKSNLDFSAVFIVFEFFIL